MTDHTDEELIALAKKCGAKDCGIKTIFSKTAFVCPTVVADPDKEFKFTIEQLRVFAHALRQQDLARMARMREALRAIARGDARPVRHIDKCAHGQYGYENCEACLMEYAENALSETSDIQELMDGQRAQWHDIATAPKDGTAIVGLWWKSGESYAGIVCFSPDNNRWYGEGEECSRPDNWMPLPAAPSARSTKEEGKSDAGAQMLMPRLLPESPLPPNPVRIDDKCNKEKR